MKSIFSKVRVVGFLSLFFVLVSTTSKADWGVGATEMTQVANNIQLAAQYAKQLQQYSTQVKKLKSATGIRDSVQFYKDLTWLNMVMGEWKVDMMDLDLDNPKSKIGLDAKKLFDKYQLFDDCKKPYFNSDDTDTCKNKMKRKVQQLATYQEVDKKLSKYSEKIQSLATKMAASKSIKESQDIANSISVFKAQFEAIQVQIALMEKQNYFMRQIEYERKVQKYAKADGKSL